MKNKFKYIIYSLVYSIVLFLVVPLLVLFIWSFTKGWAWPSLIPQAFTLQGWEYLFSASSNALEALKMSFITGIGVTIIAIAVSVPAGKALGIYDFPGKKYMKIIVLAPIIIPPLAVTMGIHITFMKSNLTDTVLGVMLVHLIPTIPYSIRILTHVFEAVGNKLEAQAQVLGANTWQRFIHVTLPLIYPGIFSAGVMVFIVSFSQYFLTFLIGGGRVVTFPMVLFPLVESGDRMLASVYSWVFIVSALLFTMLMERVFKGGERPQDHFYL
ncbi:MAG: ABC transporter permease subunit [Halanaerobiales bacterium]|nr:ABC transporter permease subunit [Halanaerobiales bacterium]